MIPALGACQSIRFEAMVHDAALRMGYSDRLTTAICRTDSSIHKEAR